MARDNEREDKKSGLLEEVVHIGRVSKVVKGGRRFRFSALVVVGDGNGRIGTGLGKANEVPNAIQKATDRAKKAMVSVPLSEGTIPHEVLGRYGSGEVWMKPANKGTGVIAGGPVRAVLEVVGVKDVLTKSIGRTNPHNVVKATINALLQLRSHEEVRRARSNNGKTN